MRYIKYAIVNLPGTLQKPAGSVEQRIIRFGLNDWLKQEVWPLPIWREDEAMMAIYFRLAPKFRVAKEGEYVGVEDKDYEKFWPVATKKGEKLPAGITDELMELLRPVTLAPSELPEGAVATPFAVEAAKN